jgi:hypothetical protein
VASQGAGAQSDFQQELQQMLESREKRAQQDKWLALAQAGMALMSSKDPTFGGALGEAGQAGLGALRESQTTSEGDRLALLSEMEQSRMGEAQLELQRQAAAARAAGGGGGGRDRAITVGLVSALDSQINSISEALNSPMAPPSPPERTRLTNELERATQQRDMLLSASLAQYGIPSVSAAPQSSEPPVMAPSARSN